MTQERGPGRPCCALGPVSAGPEDPLLNTHHRKQTHDQ